MERTEILIVRIQATGNTGIVKNTLGYVFEVEYVLEDGRTLRQKQVRKSNRDAIAFVDSLPLDNPGRKAVFHNGEFMVAAPLVKESQA